MYRTSFTNRMLYQVTIGCLPYGYRIADLCRCAENSEANFDPRFQNFKWISNIRQKVFYYRALIKLYHPSFSPRVSWVPEGERFVSHFSTFSCGFAEPSVENLLKRVFARLRSNFVCIALSEPIHRPKNKYLWLACRLEILSTTDLSNAPWRLCSTASKARKISIYATYLP